MKRRVDSSSSSSSEESTEEEESEASCCSETDQDWLWEKLTIICHNDKFKPLDMLKGYIRFHIDSQSNTLFKAIMSDVMDGELYEIPLQKAIRFAVKMNEESITNAVNRCKENEEDDDDDDWFWYRLSEKGGDLNCQWLTGDLCHCTKCKGISVLDATSFFVKLFIDMGKDDLIKQIESDVEEESKEMPLTDAIDQTIAEYEDEILLEFKEARKTIDTCGSCHRTMFLQ